MRRILRSLFSTVALLTAMLGAPPAQTKAEREALARALRGEFYPEHVVFDVEREQREVGEFDILLFGQSGEPIIVRYCASSSVG